MHKLLVIEGSDCPRYGAWVCACPQCQPLWARWSRVRPGEHGDALRRSRGRACEMLLEEPQVCPWYPPLVLSGLAVTEDGQVHLVLLTPTARWYAGPTSAIVARRASVLVTALQHGRPQLDGILAAAVADWVLLCWETTLEQVAEAIATPALDEL